MPFNKLKLFFSFILFKLIRKFLSYSLIRLIIIKKIFAKSKVKINENLLLELLSYKLFNSNHPRRLEMYVPRIKSKKFWFKNNYHWQSKNKDKNQNFTFLDNSSKKKLNDKKIIFIGDSHGEFLSRGLMSDKSLVPENLKNIWVGSKTIIGLISKDSREEVKYKINKLLQLDQNNKKYLIFSFGSIDVRSSFYELLLRKIVNNENDLFKLFENSLDILFREIISKYKNKKNNIGIGFIELWNALPVKKFNTIPEPKSIKLLMSIKNRIWLNTFGYEFRRKKWTVKANELIKKYSKKYNIDFIETDSILNTKNHKKIFLDGVHLYSGEILSKIIINILTKKK